MQFNLLEHAFDTLLEAGEIPHPLFFTEMIVQATAQSNYKRAVTLVNTVAHAPFQISKRQWTEFFEENQYRISPDKLENLLNALSDCNAASEITVSNLSSSLHSLVRSSKERISPSSTSVISQATEYAPAPIADRADPAMSSREDCEDDSDTEIVLESPTCLSNNNQRSSLFADDDASSDDEYSDYLDKKLSTLYINGGSDEDTELQMKNDGDSHEPKLPSANEILNMWKTKQWDLHPSSSSM